MYEYFILLYYIYASRELLDINFLTDFANGFGKNVSARRNLLHAPLSSGNKAPKSIPQMSYAIRSTP